ncbi:hypothetical protein [uncultured Gammaproteobacteria bacterium]|nr:hypothetical protein [uncultured Gammaproteobacteria bacterium]
MSNNFTEKHTVRLTRQQGLAVEIIAKNQNTTKTSVLRDLITSGLDNHANLNQKMLVEILMILRESIKEDKAIYTDILNARDDFKKLHGIK